MRRHKETRSKDGEMFGQTHNLFLAGSSCWSQAFCAPLHAGEVEVLAEAGKDSDGGSNRCPGEEVGDVDMVVPGGPVEAVAGKWR